MTRCFVFAAWLSGSAFSALGAVCQTPWRTNTEQKVTGRFKSLLPLMCTKSDQCYLHGIVQSYNRIASVRFTVCTERHPLWSGRKKPQQEPQRTDTSLRIDGYVKDVTSTEQNNRSTVYNCIAMCRYLTAITAHLWPSLPSKKWIQ